MNGIVFNWIVERLATVARIEEGRAIERERDFKIVFLVRANIQFALI